MPLLPGQHTQKSTEGSMCQVEKSWPYNMQNMDIQSMHMQSKVHGQALVFRVSMYVLWVSAHCIKFLYRKNIYERTNFVKTWRVIDSPHGV